MGERRPRQKNTEREMAELKLTYGKASNGRLVHVDEVQRGLACKCICPECGAKLVARKGEKKQHHFAHASGADCGGARMTALHMLAQKIIQEEKKIRTPYYDEYIKNKSKIIEFISVELEPHYSIQGINRRPDCVGKVQKDDKIIGLWIEIRVTHKVDDEKQNDIKKLDVNCMEIDLSELLHTDYTKETISAALFTEIKNKKWIHYPQLFMKNQAAKAAKEKQEAEERRRIQQEQERLRLECEKEESRLKEIVDNWFRKQDNESAEVVITEIKRKPFCNNKKEYDCCIYNFLVRNSYWLGFVIRLPETEIGHKVFYTLIYYYWRVNLALDIYTRPEFEYQIKMLLIQNNNTTTSIRLEYLLVLWVLDKLEIHRKENEDSDYGKMFADNEIIRRTVLRLIYEKKQDWRESLKKKSAQEAIEKEFKEKEGGNDIIAIIKICFHVDETQENIERYGYDPSGWIVNV